MLTRAQLSAFLAQLSAKRAETLESMNSAKQHALLDLSQDATGEISHLRLHPADQGADAADQQTELVITNMEAMELGQIDDAIQRLHEGRYGKCEACGADIAFARLQVIPEASLCLDCEADREGEHPPKSPHVMENHVRPAAYTSGEADLTELRANAQANEQTLRESGEPIPP